MNILTSHLEWKLQLTDLIGNPEKLSNSAHGLQTKETDKYTENTSRRTMLAMDTTGSLEYGLLEYDKTEGSLLIYIYSFVQKFTQNYNNRTSNTRKYRMDPVRRNVTDKWDKEKTRQKFCNRGYKTHVGFLGQFKRQLNSW